MATLTAYATTTSGRVEGVDATYLTARSTGGNAVVNGTYMYGGQTLDGGTYFCDVIFLAFDTSDIPSGASVTSATVSLDAYFAYENDTSYTAEIYAHDWGDTLTTGDWVAGGDIGGLGDILASLDTGPLGNQTYSGYTAFSSEAAMLSAIVKAGTTRFLCCSSRFRAGTAPTAAERMTWCLNITDRRPRLVVEYDEATTTFLPHVMCHHFIPQQLGGH